MKRKNDNSKSIEAVPAEALFKQKTLTGNVDVRVDGSILSLTHLDKVYWPDDGYTKGDLLKYYFNVAEYNLPYLKDRPLILKRFPNGIAAQPFFQHDLENHPDFVETVALDMEVGHTVHYAVCNNLASLLYLANLGTIPQNPWMSRTDDVHKPDWIALDLDPKKTDFTVVCEVAVTIKALLDDLGLKAYPKTSGSSGIHIYIPIKRAYDFDQTVSFADMIATVISNENPQIATRERMPAKRKKGQVYVDHLQNSYGKSIAGPYSVREKPGAPVSAPLEWSEVEKGKIRISDFTIVTMPKRLEKKGDFFEPVLSGKQTLERPIEKIKAMIE